VSSDPNDTPTRPAAAPLIEPDRWSPIGRSIRGRYRVISELGAGSFGTVYRAEDEATGHPVAIRLLPGAAATTPAVVEMIHRMAREVISASVVHKVLVRVLGLEEAESGQLFFVMELVEGRRLSEVQAERRLDLKATWRLALEVGGAAEALHSLGLVHGALRPRNVMLLEDGRVKLMDVELAGLRAAWAMEGVPTAEPPPDYLSPEQIRRAPVTQETDVYAFAAMLYEMLCGVPPFPGATREDVVAKHLADTPVPMRQRRRAIPPSIESVIALALDKRPDRRPLMQDVLDCFWEQASSSTTRWKRTAAIVGGATLAASIVGLVAWGMFAARPSAPPPPPQSAVAPVAKHAPVSAPPSSRPVVEPRTATESAPPVALPASPARRPSPSAPRLPSPPTEDVAREQLRGSGAPAAPVRARSAPSSDADAYDSGAVIDWVLKRSSERDR
jgi:serine/threonine protein kinase